MTATQGPAASAGVEAARPVTFRHCRGPVAPSARRSATQPDPLELVDIGPGPYLFLSPHLDDVALSCASLVADLAAHSPVTVASFFTDAGPAPHTLSARAFLRQCGAASAEQLYAARRAEDAGALRGLGAAVVHLGLTEALFRRRPGPSGGSRPRRPAELSSAYPTYRYHVIRGAIPRRDRHTVAAVEQRLLGCIADCGARTVIAPMAVGGHADHRIVATAAERLVPGAVYYADLPYALTAAPDAARVRRHGLVPLTRQARDDKPALLAHYRTQVDALFPGGQLPRLTECYFVPRDRLGPAS